MRKEREQFISGGYSTDYGESDDGVHCIAAQIFELDETVAGAIWISGPAKRMPKSCFCEVGSKVSTASHRISRLIPETE